MFLVSLPSTQKDLCITTKFIQWWTSSVSQIKAGIPSQGTALRNIDGTQRKLSAWSQLLGIGYLQGILDPHIKGITKRFRQKWLKCVNVKPTHFGHYLLFHSYFPHRILSYSISVTLKFPNLCPSWSLPRMSFLTCCFLKSYPFLKGQTKSLLLQGFPSFWAAVSSEQLSWDSEWPKAKLDWAFLTTMAYCHVRMCH